MPGNTPQTECWLLALGLEGPYALGRRLALWEDSDEGRNGRHVVGATGTAGRSDEAPLCRGRLFARHADLCLSQGPPRPYRHVRPYGHLARQADARGRDLPHLLLDFAPETAWNYSVSIAVLGYLVEKRSGISFGEFLRTRLFEPLGMTDTAFWVPPHKAERFTSCYQPESKGPGLKLQDDGRE